MQCLWWLDLMQCLRWLDGMQCLRWLEFICSLLCSLVADCARSAAFAKRCPLPSLQLQKEKQERRARAAPAAILTDASFTNAERKRQEGKARSIETRKALLASPPPGALRHCSAQPMQKVTAAPPPHKYARQHHHSDDLATYEHNVKSIMDRTTQIAIQTNSPILGHFQGTCRPCALGT
eukprot:1154860-Pelagomonas_calceolata.AAC.7